MRQIHRHSSVEQDYIFELHEMVKRNFPMDRIADWLAVNGLRHSNQMVANTFKRAGREDLVEYFIQEEDIKIGDTVRSRYSGRFGKVVEIGEDGYKIVVHWDAGGRQPLGKESVFKMREVEAVTELSEIKKPYPQYDNYGDIEK